MEAKNSRKNRKEKKMTLFIAIVVVIWLIGYADKHLRMDYNAGKYDDDSGIAKLLYRYHFFIFRITRKIPKLIIKKEKGGSRLVLEAVKRTPPKKSITSETLALKRAGCYREIQEWVDDVNSSAYRKRHIESWKFAKNKFDVLNVKFEESETPVQGKLSFISNDGFSRISRFTYEENGQEKYIGGRRLPLISFEQLVISFYMAKSDKHRLAYINQVAYKIQEKGKATFDIKKYEGISQYEYEATFTKRNVRALEKALNEFVVIKEDLKVGKLTVTMASEPVM